VIESEWKGRIEEKKANQGKVRMEYTDLEGFGFFETRGTLTVMDIGTLLPKGTISARLIEPAEGCTLLELVSTG
jgi:hypothetical protein